ncbi:unnamed protein product [Dovyalis caffra]|uniref:Uncharacterized protein n=1 Tax=Dovyalis caffra TaxID=77055 RepID=A0AAV1SF97_9ROSI|nr:unnamed protein product [Dovyalis caffra]
MENSMSNRKVSMTHETTIMELPIENFFIDSETLQHHEGNCLKLEAILPLMLNIDSKTNDVINLKVVFERLSSKNRNALKMIMRE